MELTLSLGEPPATPLEEIAGFGGDTLSMDMKRGFCMGLEFELEMKTKVDEENRGGDKELKKVEERRWSVDPPVQLNLLPLAPVPRLDSTQLALPWSTEDEEAEGRAAIRTISSFRMNSAMSTRGSDEEENGRGRKKLRLSKEQSAFLEESFKEQSTLNPKHKFVLARQLNLRPRQIEVWFQNRRARTKLKQMEMDCEYLNRRCDSLREENRRLHKEITELRALKTSQPFHIQIPPPTTLSICPSCNRLSPPTSPPQPPPTPR